MTITLAFLAIFAVIAVWWLAHQRLFSSPWLERGILDDRPAGVALGAAPQVGLGLLLVVIGSLFALLTGAYVIRADTADWRSVPIPPLLWVNSLVLVLTSIALGWALDAARRGSSTTLNRALTLACILGAAFLVGQLLAWQTLVASGYLVTSNPANSFFYLMTGLHGLHILGGLVAIVAVTLRARNEPDTARSILGIELCATYWLFLLLVWVVLLALISGGAAQFIDLCRQLLS